MIIDKIDRNKVIQLCKDDDYVMALKKGGEKAYESFWAGDGEEFSVLHGICTITENEGKFYHHYNKEPKLVANKEDCLIIHESDFWKYVDFSLLTDEILLDYLDHDFYRVRDGDLNLENAIQNNGEAICLLFGDLIDRGVLTKRRYLYKTI